MVWHWRKWFWLALILTTLWGILIEPGLLIVRHKPIHPAFWPKTQHPIRIALVSDLHVGMLHQSPEHLLQVVHRINAEAPDMVALLGDYLTASALPPILHQDVDPGTIARNLRFLYAPLGVYAILGNHDCWVNCRGMKRALEKVGIPVLVNTRLRLGPQGEGGFWLIGLADRSGPKPNWDTLLQDIAPDDPTLFLAHDPVWFEEIPAGPPVFMLAGHTHGGQISLPWFGPLALPTPVPLSWARGHVVVGDRHLMVTSGVGTTVLPIRVNVPPEVLILEVSRGPSRD